MAQIKSKALFFTTSPRTPSKMIPEIQLLHESFEGAKWNNSSQSEFMDKLVMSDFFEGRSIPKDKPLSARDRITRAPKALGFVDLKPTIALTDAGRMLVYGNRPQEAFLRQLIKFQLPSPYHTEGAGMSGTFFVRPYLEIIRLVSELGKLTFDECKIFAMQLTDYRKYDSVKASILAFREEKEERKGQYKKLEDEKITEAIMGTYEDNIAQGKIETREAKEASLKKFITTKKSNLRDYADACFRYLRYTGLFVYSGHSIVVASERAAEVEYILANTERKPVFVDDETAYKAHLFSATEPMLYVDIKENIVDTVMKIGAYTKRELISKGIEELKDLRDELVKKQRDAVIDLQITELKSYSLYSEITEIFNDIHSGTLEFYDAPLMFEYNTWRAMTMLNGGSIKGNFKIDDIGQPLSTAQGNMADIECDYGDFALSVEVTLQGGQRQYDTEGEPVTRHYARLRQKTGKDTYCLFIAKRVNMATFEHFWGINQIPNMTAYGGKPRIIPLELEQFMQLVENSYTYHTTPTPADMRSFLQSTIDQLEGTTGAMEWKERIDRCVIEWLAA
ncbi:MAG: AlwI family type II restriction endonuclease [Defluviitaleaceae bacterium]|nr:AlwI family type II restriction endonuclease [Defluviitaleaceae bacterium]